MSQFNITDFPSEILEKIFFYFDDTTNTTIARICKRFNEVVSHTVSRKYNGRSSQKKCYEIEIYDSSIENERHEIMQHHPFILKHVSAIKLIFHDDLNNRNHWIFRIMDTIGRNIKMIWMTAPSYNAESTLHFHHVLTKTPNISHLFVEYVYPINRKWCFRNYRKLTHLEMKIRKMFNENELKPFVKRNKQLKHVTLEIIDFSLLKAFHGSKIQSLLCRFSPLSANQLPVRFQPIQMTNLKSLNLAVPKNALNECIENIVAPCQNIKDLSLVNFSDTIAVTDKSVDILCSLRSIEKLQPCYSISLEHITQLIAELPILVSMELWHSTINDFRVVLKEANKHTTLRHIRFLNRNTDIYDHSLLSWLMENVNDRVQVEFSYVEKLIITKGRVQFDGVTIMSSNGSPIQYEKVNKEWLERIQIMTYVNDQCYDFFSNLPILREFVHECDTDLHIKDETSERVVKRKGKNIRTASTTLSSDYEKSVTCINWLEKYCSKLEELSFYIEDNHDPEEPEEWIFPELKILRIHCRPDRDFVTQSFNGNFFTSLKCQHLSCFKILGQKPLLLTNIQIIHNIDLFDNLVTLEVFNFNESTINLLESFNANVHRNLRNLTLVNRLTNGSRYKMNNKTVSTIAKFTELIQLKLILDGIIETNTKYLFENCTKLVELYLECNFLSSEEFIYKKPIRLFTDIKANCYSLLKLQLVWNQQMMDPHEVYDIKCIFPKVLVKIMQVNKYMRTTAMATINERVNQLEPLFDEFFV